MKIKKTIFVYKCPLFETEVLICIGSSLLKEKTIVKELENSIKSYSGCVNCFGRGKSNYYLIWLENFVNNWYWLDILNHEIVHLRQFLFENKGIKDEFECEAYFQEKVFRNLRQILRKKYEKRKS